MPEPKFETLFREELEMLYDAEKQVAEAFPKLIAAASAQPLATALQQHRDETEKHIDRLEQIFQEMGEQPSARICEAMQALLQEGETLIARLNKSPVLDTGLIGTVRKIENYEICGYETVRSLAEVLGQQDASDFLEEALEDITIGNEGLTDLGEAILSGEELGEEDIDDGELEIEGLVEEEIVEEPAEREHNNKSAG
jgi:ferritin-like metal-binding protein YciE